MNYLERLLYASQAQTPAMLPEGGPRIQPPVPPHVRLRSPNAPPAAPTFRVGAQARALPARARRGGRALPPRTAARIARGVRFVGGPASASTAVRDAKRRHAVKVARDMGAKGATREQILKAIKPLDPQHSDWFQ